MAAQLHCHQSRGSFLADAGVAALPEEAGRPLSPRSACAQLAGFLPLPHWQQETPERKKQSQDATEAPDVTPAFNILPLRSCVAPWWLTQGGDGVGPADDVGVALVQLSQAGGRQLLLAVLPDVPGVHGHRGQFGPPPVVCLHHTVAPLDVHPLQHRPHRRRLATQQRFGVARLQFQVKLGALNQLDGALRMEGVEYLEKF